jgi:hypothetical protein
MIIPPWFSMPIYHMGSPLVAAVQRYSLISSTLTLSSSSCGNVVPHMRRLPHKLELEITLLHLQNLSLKEFEVFVVAQDLFW